MQVAPGIRRIGNGLVNVYLIEDQGQITIIDAGLPGYFGHELLAELGAMGRTLADVRTVVLTHAHSDHLGFAERIRSECRVEVRIHEADAALARGEVKPARDPDGHALGGMRPRSLLGFLLYAARRNGLRTPSVRQVATFGDGATLDVPGSPRVVLVPGHTSGSAVLIVESLAAAFVGDAFATRNVMSGAVGPRLAPFGADLRQAYDSLARLEGIDSRYVLPGHGQPWTDGLAAAVARVRELGRP